MKIHRFFRYSLAPALLVVASGCEAEPPEATPTPPLASVQLEEAWTLDTGLSRPESVVYDADRDVLYISNINDAENGRPGYVSRIAPTGEVLDSAWVDGLQAPKGLAFMDNVLYVSDVDELLAVDPATGVVSARYPVEGEVYLNDVTAAEGRVFVSDSRYSVVYTLEGEQLVPWLEAPDILMPNGVHIVDSRLLIAAGDSTTDEPGANRYLRQIDLGTGTLGAPMDVDLRGALDAIEPDGTGGYFVTDWGAGTLSYVTPDGTAELLATLGQGSADVEYVIESQMLYVPVMASHRLIAYQVSHQDTTTAPAPSP